MFHADEQDGRIIKTAGIQVQNLSCNRVFMSPTCHFEGGLPINVEDQCIGGVGVSGAPSAVDRQIGEAGIEAFSKT